MLSCNDIIIKIIIRVNFILISKYINFHRIIVSIYLYVLLNRYKKYHQYLKSILTNKLINIYKIFKILLFFQILDVDIYVDFCD